MKQCMLCQNGYSATEAHWVSKAIVYLDFIDDMNSLAIAEGKRHPHCSLSWG